ncbi:MAG TPA: PAS domain S-box protein, partial [Terracidiphilus sp.]|nr:PAS domain S-box protein [Terracidiphilus sp.]
MTVGELNWRAPEAGSVQVETELLKRDRILDAITKIAAGLLAATTLDAALPAALRQVGEAIGTDRVVVLKATRAPDGGFLVHERGAWNAPGVEPRIHAGEPADGSGAPEIPGNFFATLIPGQIFTAFPRTMHGPLAEFLTSLNVQSLLFVPILLEGEPWGYLGFDDCHSEREWTTPESDALQVLAEIIGASISRARYTAELADAKRIVDSSTTVLFRNKAGPGMPVTYISGNVSKWGYSPAQFLLSSTFYLDTVHSDDLPQVMAWIRKLLTEGSAPTWLIFRIRFADGNYHWFENHISAIHDHAGSLIAFEGMMFDITERKQAEDRLNFVNTLFQTAMEKSPNGFLVVGADRRILTYNQRFLDMWKIPVETAKTEMDEALPKAVVESLKDPPGFLATLERLYEHPEQDVQDEIEFQDGRIFERHSAALWAQDQHYLGRIFFFRDITERKRDEREMARLARTDALTGLANRATFLDRLNLALAAARRGDTAFAVHYV